MRHAPFEVHFLVVLLLIFERLYFPENRTVTPN